ncbi:SCO family protein [Litchfieldia alkalitelluris]|uniref:SCO family protein n=1 Tax=Litchfieldia alkalitelluris TaxID=304268 RepID=UPI001F27093D|nr:SCO family protein [Litchfieldia alkalitelluris]
MNGKKFLFMFATFVVFLGLVTSYWLWPKSEQLPVLERLSPFVLLDQDGNEYRSNNGKIKLVTFYYINCPDVCPLTMYDLKVIQDQLKKEGLNGTEVELIAITLDPENDTLDRIRKYAGAFNTDNEGWKFLRGNSEETEEITNMYHMKYQKLRDDFIAHNTTMYLVDSKEQIRALYNMANQSQPVDRDNILGAIRQLSKEK